MKLPISPKLVVGIVFGLVHMCANSIYGQPWTLPRDADGWSILEPSVDSRLIYVSSTEGDDGTAEFYSPAQVGANPHHPSLSVKAYRTIESAIAQVRNGYPDWVLLKTGDAWVYQLIQLHYIGQGRSPSERIVFTYYGSGDQRPLIKTDGNGIRSWNIRLAKELDGIHYWAFIGIEFYNHKADPDSPDYSPSVTHTQGTSLSSGGSYFLFEDCKFNFVEIIVHGVDRNWEQVEVRRNIVVDTYYINSCFDRNRRPSGMFAKYIVNLLVEENTFDHNGWSERFPNSGRNAYNHNLYMSWEIYQDVISRGNINARASGNASQWRGGALVEKNLYIQGPAGVFVGHEDGNAAMVAIKDNVLVEGVSMGGCSQASSATWGITVDEVDFRLHNSGVAVENNIVAHHHNYPARVGLERADEVAYDNNIVYAWNLTEDMWDDQWLDPERSVGSYHQSIGGVATTEAFLESARNRGVRHWPQEYSAYSVINYIREGFNMPPVSSESGIVAVTGISLPEPSMQIGGETVKLVPTIYPSNASYKSVTWSSSNQAVASVDQLGNVTGIDSGTTIITAHTNDGGFAASVAVTVVNIPVSSIDLNVNALSIYEGQTYDLVANVLPLNAFDLSVTWTSSDSTIASVDGQGRVLALSEGVSTVRAITNSGALEASCVVAVYSLVPAEGWAETFEGLPDGTVVDNGETAWSLLTEGINSSAVFEVKEGSFLARNLGSEAVFVTETIEIQDRATIIVDWEADGALEDTDYMKAYYVLDGGPEVLFGEVFNVYRRNKATVSVNGSTVKVVVRLLNTATNEDHYLHNIVVGKTEIPGSNTPPVLSPIGDRNIPSGQQLRFNVDATDPDGNGLQFSASGGE